MAKKAKPLIEQLSPEVIALAEARERVDLALPDAHRFNRVIDHLEAAGTMTDPKQAMLERLRWEPQLYVAACRVIHGGKDPHEVPLPDMLYCLSVTEPFIDNPEFQRAYRVRIKGPLTAIRARCMSCMEGQRTAISECASTNCANFPFRLGNNPFYGRIPEGDAVSNVEAEEAEDAAELQTSAS